MTKQLSLNDFKNWLSEQNGMSEFFSISKDPEDPNERFIGNEVRPKVSEGKLLEKARTEGDTEQLVQEFVEDGGVVLSIEGKKVNIQLESGELALPRFCVRIRK
jgi:hypothetical protein